MTTYKVEIKRFDGSGDFSMWKTRMMAHIRTSGLKEALLSEDLTFDKAAAKKSDQNEDDKDKEKELDPAKVDRSEKARDLIIMHVSNQVLRKINHCETAVAMWKLLDELYTESSLPNRIYLQLKLYTYKMVESKTIDQNADDYLKLIVDLAQVGVQITEEAQAVILLSSLPSKYDQLKDTLKYGKQSLNLNEVISSAKSKERELLENGKLSKNSAEGLYVERGRKSDKKDSKRGNNRSKSRSRCKSKGRSEKGKGCFICGSEDH